MERNDSWYETVRNPKAATLFYMYSWVCKRSQEESMEAETMLELKSWGVSISKTKTTVLLIAVSDLELLPQGTGDTFLSQYKQG